MPRIFWVMFSNVAILGYFYVTNFTVCWGLCNLCSQGNVTTDQSSTYRFTAEDPKIDLTADRAVNGKFLDHRGGDCAGTRVDGVHNQSWWNISLPDLAIIYKINLMFREENTRHYGYYIFINNQEIDIEGLASLTPVYHEENEKHPSVQNIIMFPGGIQGKQMYIYQNKSNATDDNTGDQKNNVLDICEVEIWGCLDQNGDEMNCSCPQNENFTVLPQETLTSVVAWTSINNPLTLKCDQGNVILQQSKHQCDFKPKCVLRYTNKSALFFCSNCTEPIYNTTTTELQQPRPIYTLSVGDNVTYTCKRGHRLAAGNLTRICQENGSWSGVEPFCKPCTVATFNANTTDAEYFQPNDTLNVGDNVTYTCKTGYRLAAGNLTRICQENGSWTGEEPYCKRCKCSCKRLSSQNFIKDPIVLKERIEETKKILKLKRSELSAFKRKKISSFDGRASSTGIGMTLGVGVITFVIGAIVCCDLLTCRARRRRRPLRKA